MGAAIVIAGTEVRPGERATIELPLPQLYTHSQMKMTAKVINGKRKGPTLFLCGALHGDELNSVDIIRRVLSRIEPSEISGCILAVPIVNVFGFISQSRYLPDRRDLNRSFPGSASGSLAARIADTFMREIVQRSQFGIDLHTAALNRVNLPQVRANLEDPETRRGAQAFGARAAIHSGVRDGSLREAAKRTGTRVWVYEGGEPLRFNEDAIDIGVRGVLRLMQHLGMRKSAPRRMGGPTREYMATTWVRARQSGVLHLVAELGAQVTKGQVLASVTDPYGDRPATLKAPHNGLVIGHATNPLVHRGDAVLHLASDTS